MLPLVGSSKPAISRSVVVLPQPEGPSSEKNSPASMRNDTSSTARTPPKRLVSPTSSISPPATAVVSVRPLGEAARRAGEREGRRQRHGRDAALARPREAEQVRRQAHR